MPALIANRPLRANGVDVAAGETFTIDDGQRAAVLVRVGSARPVSGDDVGTALAVDESVASRRAVRPNPIPVPTRQPEPVEQTLPSIDGLRRLSAAVAASDTRDALGALVAYLAEQERRLAVAEGRLAAATRKSAQ